MWTQKNTQTRYKQNLNFVSVVCGEDITGPIFKYFLFFSLQSQEIVFTFQRRDKSYNFKGQKKNVKKFF